jgi:hypothetical protein
MTPQKTAASSSGKWNDGVDTIWWKSNEGTLRSRRSAGRGTKSEKSEMEYDDTAISCGVVVREVGWWCG